MGETTRPKLLKSKQAAQQRIKKQIGRGQHLVNQAVHLLSITLGVPNLLNNKLNKLGEIGEISTRWSKYNADLLDSLFSSTSIRENDYAIFAFTEPETKVIRGVKISVDPMSRIEHYTQSMNVSIDSLKGIYERLELYDDYSETSQRTPCHEDISDNSTRTCGEEVFIVHGRNEAAKHAIAIFVERLGLKAIILDEQPDDGLTIIEKLEREAQNVGFAIAALTPDDVGALKDEADEQLKLRARQNVIFELGYFMGKLGRPRVCLLIEGELENPSDLDGLLYVPISSSNEWQLKLATAMQRAGLPVDLNKLT